MPSEDKIKTTTNVGWVEDNITTQLNGEMLGAANKSNSFNNCQRDGGSLELMETFLLLFISLMVG